MSVDWKRLDRLADRYHDVHTRGGIWLGWTDITGTNEWFRRALISALDFALDGEDLPTEDRPIARALKLRIVNSGIEAPVWLNPDEQRVLVEVLDDWADYCGGMIEVDDEYRTALSDAENALHEVPR